MLAPMEMRSRRSWMSWGLPVLLLAATVASHREHKVHNIVLYPDKQSWCKTTPIKQVVAMPGYKPVTIDNNVCVGACFSYSIPSTEPAEPGELIRPYCDSCQPVETRCYHVTLEAEDLEAEAEGGGQPPLPATRQKRVQIIDNCTCLSCGGGSGAAAGVADCDRDEERTSELPLGLFSKLHQVSTEEPSEHDLPELLHFRPDEHRKDTEKLHMAVQNASTPEERYAVNARLIALLRSIQQHGEQQDSEEEGADNFRYDRRQLSELLALIEGSSESRLSEHNLADLVNFVNVHRSADVQLDLSRLREVLLAADGERRLRDRHRQYGLGALAHTTDIDRNTLEQEAERERPEAAPTLGALLPHHHHHYAGEALATADGGPPGGHLQRGPHGSLVLVPDMLRPALAGTVLSYHNHPTDQTHRQHHQSKPLPELPQVQPGAQPPPPHN